MNESTLVPREEVSDLDWLARNVHVWPAGDHQPWCYVYWKGGQRAVSGNCITVILPCVRVEMSDWLARRAELQNKPIWDDAPEWAEWLAQHESGYWCWGSGPASISVQEGAPVAWWSEKNQWSGKAGEVLGDWRDTLEKRPEGSMVSMSGVHSNGDMEKLLDELNDIDESIFGDGFIPKDAATAKQQAPKGSGNPILGMVLADLTNRALEGKEKYGEPLLANNGRNPLWDAYQEALDLAMYLRQAIEENR